MFFEEYIFLRLEILRSSISSLSSNIFLNLNSQNSETIKALYYSNRTDFYQIYITFINLPFHMRAIKAMAVIFTIRNFLIIASMISLTLNI